MFEEAENEFIQQLAVGDVTNMERVSVPCVTSQVADFHISVLLHAHCGRWAKGWIFSLTDSLLAGHKRQIFLKTL